MLESWRACSHLPAPVPASPSFPPARAPALPKGLFQALRCRQLPVPGLCTGLCTQWSLDLLVMLQADLNQPVPLQCPAAPFMGTVGTRKSRVSQSPFQVQQGREKMGVSALCSARGVQEQGCWGAKALQLDPVSTRVPGPPLVTEIHITRALSQLAGVRQNCSTGSVYILSKWKTSSRWDLAGSQWPGCLMVWMGRGR